MNTKRTQSIVTVALLSLSLTGMATSSNSQSSSQAFDGFYVGVQLGNVVTNMNLTNEYTPGQFLGQSASNINFIPTLDMGYGKVFGKYYLGLQVEVDLLAAEASETDLGHNPSSTQYKRQVSLQQQFSLDLQPGYLINDHWLVYTDVGVAYMKQQYQQWIKEGTDASWSDEAIDDNTAYLYQPKFGIGTAYAISPNVSVNTNISYIGDSSEQTHAGKITEVFTIKGYEMRYMAGINYRF